jgi:GT2 family glycosyltransferase
MSANIDELPAAVTVGAGRLTLGVAVHGNVDVTVRCLQAIFSSVAGEFDLILVDDASAEDVVGLFREAREFHPRTRIFRFGQNREYSHSVNCILRSAATEVVAFVSNDVFITPTYVRGLLAAMADPAIGIARGVSNFVDGIIDSPLHNIDVPDGIAGYEDMARFAARRHALGNALSDDLFLTGDAFAVRRAVVDRLGGFDTGLVGYLSDIDFGIRTRQAGWRKVVCAGAFAWHAQDANIRYLPDEERRRKVERRKMRVDAAWKRLRAKWGLDEVPEDWQSTHLLRIPFARLEAMEFREEWVAPPVSYAEFELD